MKNYKKIFAFTIVFFSLFFTTSYSEIVKTIEIKGNERISDETVLIFGDVALGKNYEISDVNSLIQKLYETAFFADISVQLKENKLTITVKENPIVNEVVFQGEYSAAIYLDSTNTYFDVRTNPELDSLTLLSTSATSTS